MECSGTIHAPYLEKRGAVASAFSGLRGPPLEVVAGLAVTNVEIVPNDWEEHRVRAKEQVPVLDGVDGELQREVRGTARVPAGAVLRLRLDGGGNRHSIA